MAAKNSLHMGAYIAQVIEEVNDFLASSDRSVLLLKGEWGVGKTYFWCKQASKYAKEKSTVNMVSYVSLFGMRTLDDLKRSIFQNAEAISEDSALKTAKGLVKKAYNLSNLLPEVRKYQDITFRIQDVLINRYLICIDDIERKDNSLSMASVLGLISILKEHHKCKIVLISNEELLDDDDKKELDKYREKVIDVELTYCPPVEDNASLIYEDGDELTNATRIFQALQVNNIRVMQQAQWTLQRVRSAVADMEISTETMARLECHCLLIAAFHYVPGLNVDLNRLQHLLHLQILRDQSKEERDVNDLLARCDYHWLEFDEPLIQLMQTGQLPSDKLTSAIQTIEAREEGVRAGEDMRTAWALYRSNFQADAEDIINAFKKVRIDYWIRISDEDFDGIANLLNSLGKEEMVCQIREDRDLVRISTLNYYELESLQSVTTDDLVAQEIKKRMREIRSQSTIKDLLYSVVEKAGCGRDTIQLLASYTEDEYRNWLLKEDDPNLLSNIEAILRLWGSGEEDLERRVCERIESALGEIAKRSQLDKLRVTGLLGVRNGEVLRREDQDV